MQPCSQATNQLTINLPAETYSKLHAREPGDDDATAAMQRVKVLLDVP